MYLSFYGLSRRPFRISTDPAFLWLNADLKNAVAKFKHGIQNHEGVLLLTGDVGTGKTTMVNGLLESLGDGVTAATVSYPMMKGIDFLNYISHQFNMGKEFTRKTTFLIHFGHFLRSAHAHDKKVVLAIDEAQRLPPEVLEEIRQLSNLEHEGVPLLSVLLAGQNQLVDMLNDSASKAIRQRILTSYGLQPLNSEDTADMVRFRLRVAGSELELFTPEALEAVHHYTGGVQRRINSLCDRCMITGCSAGEHRISASTVHTSERELRLPGEPVPALTLDKRVEQIAINISSPSGSAVGESPETLEHEPVVPDISRRPQFAGALIGAMLAVLVFGSVYYMLPAEGESLPPLTSGEVAQIPVSRDSNNHLSDINRQPLVAEQNILPGMSKGELSAQPLVINEPAKGTFSAENEATPLSSQEITGEQPALTIEIGRSKVESTAGTSLALQSDRGRGDASVGAEPYHQVHEPQPQPAGNVVEPPVVGQDEGFVNNEHHEDMMFKNGVLSAEHVTSDTSSAQALRSLESGHDAGVSAGKASVGQVAARFADGQKEQLEVDDIGDDVVTGIRGHDRGNGSLRDKSAPAYAAFFLEQRPHKIMKMQNFHDIKISSELQVVDSGILTTESGAAISSQPISQPMVASPVTMVVQGKKRHSQPTDAAEALLFTTGAASADTAPALSTEDQKSAGNLLQVEPGVQYSAEEPADLSDRNATDR